MFKKDQLRKLVKLQSEGWIVNMECTTKLSCKLELSKEELDTIIDDYDGDVEDWLETEMPEKYSRTTKGFEIEVGKIDAYRRNQ